MGNYKLFAFILLSLVMTCCDGKKNKTESYFSFDSAKLKPTYVNNDAVLMEISNKDSKKIDSIIYYVNDKKVSSVIGQKSAEAKLDVMKFGYQSLKALVYYNGDSDAETVLGRIEIGSSVSPKILKYSVVNVYPHDVNAFTEGLEFYRDTLLESTGQNGMSWIRKLDYKTGKVYKQVDLSREYFGEGITVIDGKIFQLTWQSLTGFIYDANSLKLEKTFKYDKKVEGWGMTNDGTHIYHSDGTEKIWKMDATTQKLVDYVNVYSAATKIKSINELEWIDGKIFGNIWQKDAIAVIDPETVSVTAVINLAELRKQVTSENAEVLNGIAYNKTTKTLFVTGKHWDKMFEIKIE